MPPADTLRSVGRCADRPRLNRRMVRRNACRHPAARAACGWLRIVALVLALLGVAAAHAEPPPRVLVLYSNARPLPANLEFAEAFESTLRAAFAQPVEVLSEYLDDPRFSGDAYAATMSAYLRGKYAAAPPAVIVAAGDPALAFWLRHRADLFPQAPVVHAAVAHFALEAIGPLPPDVIGTPMDLDIVKTIEQALRWQPRSKRVVTITGASAWDRAWQARLDAGLRQLSRSVEVVALAALPTATVLERVRALGTDSVVYTPGYLSDGDGRVGTPRESVVAIAAASGAPVYGPYSTFIGTGIVGGVMADFPTAGKVAARTVAELLNGTPAAAVSVPARLPETLHVDWRALQRFGIRAADVPAGAVIHFKAPSFWETYRQWVIVATVFIVLQTALIAALLIERARRRRTAVALARSKQRLSLAADAARLTTWAVQSPPLGKMFADREPPEGGLPGLTDEPMAVPKPAAASTGLFHPAAASAGRIQPADPAVGQIHPADRAGVEQAVHEALRSGNELEVEYRLVEPDGGARWLMARGRAAAGDGQQLLGVALDITPRKRAEEQVAQDRSMLRHMMRVSLLGQMSASIAHQLNQPLAAILANAEAAQKMLGRTPVDTAELGEICADIVAADQRAADVIRRLGALFKRGELAAAPLDLNALVRDTIDLTRTELQMRHVGVDAVLAAQPATLAGDRVQLQQLLLNLIFNAAEAMADVPEAQRRIAIRTERKDGEIVLAVADRGPGIAEADLPRLFDAFWTTKATGVGVGLPICRAIALAHGGRLEASNVPGGGALFRAILPASPAPER